MASAQVEEGSAAAAAAPEHRLYYLGPRGVSCLARLEPCDPLPPGTPRPHADDTVDGVAEDAQVGPGFYLAVLEGGEVVDLAHLTSLDGQPLATTREEAKLGDDGGSTGKTSICGEKEETPVGKGEGEVRSAETANEEGEMVENTLQEERQEEEETVEGKLQDEDGEGTTEEGEEAEGTSEKDGDWKETSDEEEGERTSEQDKDWEETSDEEEGEGTSEKDEGWVETSDEEEGEGTSEKDKGWEETSDEEEGEDTSEKDEDWEETSDEEDFKDSKDGSFLQMRIWPGSSYAVLIVFNGGCWNMTKAYHVKWLERREKLELLRTINKYLDRDGAITCETMAKTSLTLSPWTKECLLRLDFEGPLLYPCDLDEAVNTELNPTTDHFKFGKQLGKGGSGKVYQCTDKDAYIMKSYAVKITKVKKHEDIDAYNRKEPREVHMMACLKDPKVVTFYKAWIANECYQSSVDHKEVSDTDLEEHSDDSGSDLCERYVLIQMEVCVRTVADILSTRDRDIKSGEMSIEESWALFEKITQAVQVIHQKGAIHRDVKPANMFVGEDGEIKLGDLGHACWKSCYIDGREGTPHRGTQLYVAPELLDGQVTDKVDIFSIGAMFLEIFYRLRSYHERHEVLMGLKCGKYPSDFTGDIVLLKRLTALHPAERPSTVDILDCIGRRL